MPPYPRPNPMHFGHFPDRACAHGGARVTQWPMRATGVPNPSRLQTAAAESVVPCCRHCIRDHVSEPPAGPLLSLVLRRPFPSVNVYVNGSLYATGVGLSDWMPQPYTPPPTSLAQVEELSVARVRVGGGMFGQGFVGAIAFPRIWASEREEFSIQQNMRKSFGLSSERPKELWNEWAFTEGEGDVCDTKAYQSIPLTKEPNPQNVGDNPDLEGCAYWAKTNIPRIDSAPLFKVSGFPVSSISPLL